MKGPLCKVCGKPVPKDWHWVQWKGEDEPPSLEAARRRVNGVILSVQRSYNRDGHITGAHVWDGESYVWGGHFHAQSCAASFGKSMADQFPDYSCEPYKVAWKARHGT